MNREILFRGKRIDNGEWVEGSVLRSGNGCVDIVPLNNSICEDKYGGLCAMKWCEVDSKTVCQYTGLTDKNGRKIFEGDILSFSAYGEDYKGDVRFIKGSFTVWCGKCAPFLDDALEKHSATVINNIYDNPECSACKCRNCFSRSECCSKCDGPILGCEEYSETDIYNPDLLEGETHESHN